MIRTRKIRINKYDRVILDEKYFRRLENFNGDITACRRWLFDLLTALNQIDSDLAKEINKVVNGRGMDGWKWEHEGRKDMGVWKKYHSEL